VKEQSGEDQSTVVRSPVHYINLKEVTKQKRKQVLNTYPKCTEVEELRAGDLFKTEINSTMPAFKHKGRILKQAKENNQENTKRIWVKKFKVRAGWSLAP